MKPQIFKRDGEWFLIRPRLLGFRLFDDDAEMFGPYSSNTQAYADMERFERFGSTEGLNQHAGGFDPTNRYREPERWKDS